MSLTELIHFDKDGRVEDRGLFKKLFLSLVILLVGVLGFGVGRLTGEGQSEPVRIEYDQSLSSVIRSVGPAPLEVGDPQIPVSSNGVVASGKGTKYHYPYCAGAKQISEANKITFASRETAEAAGYTLASNCKPK